MRAPGTYQRFIGNGHAEIPNPSERPERCRAIIFSESEEGAYVLGIGRRKPGRAPYIVFPGGGLEPEDTTPKNGVWRELQEELGIDPASVYLGDEVIQNDTEYFYAGYAVRDLGRLVIGGPESLRLESESGTYTPGWYPVGRLVELNCQPMGISRLIDGTAELYRN